MNTVLNIFNVWYSPDQEHLVSSVYNFVFYLPDGIEVQLS